MKSVEKSARTVDEAIDEALRELEAARAEVDVEILEEGSKGLFGLLGGKQARVLVRMKDPHTDRVEAGSIFLQGLLTRLGADAQVRKSVAADGTAVLEMTGSELGLVIGRRGQMLDAIQYLVNVVANKGAGEWVRIMLDAEGYRQRREEALQGLALRVAARVKTQGKKQALEPMSAAERRIVHMVLADDAGVETRSEGEDPYRRVVIVPARQ